MEILLSVRFHDVSDISHEPQSSEASPIISHIELTGDSSEHGITVEGGPACCRESGGLVDCLGCLESDMSMFLVGLDRADTDIVNHISAVVRNAAAKGVTKDELFVRTYFICGRVAVNSRCCVPGGHECTGGTCLGPHPPYD